MNGGYEQFSEKWKCQSSEEEFSLTYDQGNGNENTRFFFQEWGGLSGKNLSYIQGCREKAT